MLMTLFTVLVILWLLGMVSSYTLGGYVQAVVPLSPRLPGEAAAPGSHSRVDSAHPGA